MGGGGGEGCVCVCVCVCVCDGGGAPYTKLSHPYSSHANGKTTQWLFLRSNGANWKREREQAACCSRGVLRYVDVR